MHKLLPFMDLTTCENCESEKRFVGEKKSIVYDGIKRDKNTKHVRKHVTCNPFILLGGERHKDRNASRLGA